MIKLKSVILNRANTVTYDYDVITQQHEVDDIPNIADWHILSKYIF